MAIDRVQIANNERWGRLVKTWATGRNYLEDGNDYPKPTNLEKFKEQLSRAQVGATIPEHLRSFRFAEAGLDTLLVRLPPKEMIEDSEARLMAPGTPYPLAPFYKRVFGGKDPEIAKSEMMKFHAERVGEYTINNCV
jgi:hypothetical protein